MSDPANRPYTEPELAAYLERIGLPSRTDVKTLVGEIERDPKAGFGRVIRAHLERVPFENTFIHLAQPRASPALDPTSLHARITEKHLGGYCFFHSLNSTNLALGLSALQTPKSSGVEGNDEGARGWRIKEARPVLGVVCVGKDKESNQPLFEGRGEPTHCVTLLELREARTGRQERFIMDIGFGRKGPIGLVPLPPSPTGSDKEGAKGEVIWHDSLRGEAWRIRRPKDGELPPPAEALEEKWKDCHPLTDAEGRKNYLMEHRLFALGQDPSEDEADDEDAWETLYAFNLAAHGDLGTFQTLSGHVFEGKEGCTTKFKEHLTVSRTCDLGQGLEFPGRSETEDRGTEKRSMGRLALTDMVLSTFMTTETGEGKKEVIKEYTNERERNEDLKRLFGLTL